MKMRVSFPCLLIGALMWVGIPVPVGVSCEEGLEPKDNPKTVSLFQNPEPPLSDRSEGTKGIPRTKHLPLPALLRILKEDKTHDGSPLLTPQTPKKQNIRSHTRTRSLSVSSSNSPSFHDQEELSKKLNKKEVKEDNETLKTTNGSPIITRIDKIDLVPLGGVNPILTQTDSRKEAHVEK